MGRTISSQSEAVYMSFGLDIFLSVRFGEKCGMSVYGRSKSCQ